MTEREIDEVTGTTTTGHEWDGIKELNTPLPRWWLWTFYALHRLGAGLHRSSIRPGRCITSATGGVLGYSSRADLADEHGDGRSRRRAMCSAQIAATPVDDILADDDLARFAVARPDARRSR